MADLAKEVQTKKYVALTFDDGPNTTTTVEVLDKLEKYGVIASFFVIGDYINTTTKAIVHRAFRMGCEIDNHSKTHSVMPELTKEDIVSELQFTLDKVKAITGTETPFFRPPYIEVDDRMLELIELPFICGYGCKDWEDDVTVEERFQSVMDQMTDGNIVLLHDLEGNNKTVQALDLIIPALLEQGYTFVTVSELFAKKGIQPKKSFVYSNVLDQ